MDEKEEEHAQQIEDVIADLKSSSTETIQKAKIKMKEDVEKGNTRSQNVAGWRDALAKLTGKHVNINQDLAKKKKEKEGGEEKIMEGGGDQTLDAYVQMIKSNFYFWIVICFVGLVGNPFNCCSLVLLPLLREWFDYRNRFIVGFSKSLKMIRIQNSLGFTKLLGS